MGDCHFERRIFRGFACTRNSYTVFTFRQRFVGHMESPMCYRKAKKLSRSTIGKCIQSSLPHPHAALLGAPTYLARAPLN